MARVSDKEFIQTWQQLGSTLKVANALGMNERSVRRKKAVLSDKLNIPFQSNIPKFLRREHYERTDCELPNGVIVVGSDVHKWPGENTPAQQAFINVIKEIQPDLIVLNGDVFDGASVSRWPKSTYGLKIPTVKEELEAIHQYLDEIKAASRTAKYWWTLGNHDMRFEAKLANLAPEYEGVPGFSLQDQFPDWCMSISLMVNEKLMIKHRFRNGIHATWNNVLHSGGGISICTGHVHRLQASIFSSYAGTAWGIDCGTLGETIGPQMHYGEDNPANHCAGFAVLTIINGQLVHPEFCVILGDRAFFRGREVEL